jgi:hypothetical protein
MTGTIVAAVAILATAQAKASAARDFLQPTRITLNAQNRTLAEIVDAINKQRPELVALRTGIKPAPRGERADASRTKEAAPRFTIREPTPLPFWLAIDRVCEATQQWPTIETPAGSLGRLLDPRVILSPIGPGRALVCHDGPFRIVLTGLLYDHELRFASRSFTGPRPGQDEGGAPGDTETFYAQITVMAEPRLRIRRVEDFTLQQAIDDRGSSLLTPRSDRPHPISRAGPIEQAGTSAQIFIPLVYPDDPGKLIKRLRGVVPIDVSARQKPSENVTAEVKFDFTDVPMP